MNDTFDKNENGEFNRSFRPVRSTDRFLLIDKSPGIPFHSTGKKKGILQLIRLEEERGTIPSGDRLFPVHRLDLITSGLLLFARGRKNANLLSNEFRHNRVEKFYVALSDRSPSKKQGRIQGDMNRGRRGAWILTRSRQNPAITDFQSAAIPGRRPGLRFYLLKPRTGRTHQVRVALKSLGAPLLGDPLYGRYDLAREEERAYLHACALRFRLAGESFEIVSAPHGGAEFESTQFREVWERYSNPFLLDWPGR